MAQSEDTTIYRWLFDVDGTELAVIYPVPNVAVAQAETDAALASSIQDSVRAVVRRTVRANRPELVGAPVTFVSRTEITNDDFARILEDASDANP